MASFKLFFNYVIKKLSDQDPWDSIEVREPVEKQKWVIWLDEKWQVVKGWLVNRWNQLWHKPSKQGDGKPQDHADPPAEEG